MKYTYNKAVKSTSLKTFTKEKLLIVTSILMFALSLSGFSSAKEITSGGNPTTGGTVVCSNVKSLSYKGDARVGETGLASIDINYSVSPCDKTRPVRVEVILVQNVTDATPLYQNDNALMSDKITVFGVLVGKSYLAKVNVYDANSGAFIEARQIFAAAVRKVGV